MLSRLLRYLALLWFAIEHAELPRCEHCGRWSRLELQSKQTYYDDHRSHYLFCCACAATYRDYWDWHWDNLYPS